MYALVQWPETQIIMDQPWFDTECFLANNERVLHEIGSSAYFVPVERIEEMQDLNVASFDGKYKIEDES